MFKGYYMLTSGMLTQNRNLNVTSNNMANASTPGFKSDTLVSTTFAEELQYRTGNLDKNRTLLNTQVKPGKIRTVVSTVTNHKQGILEDTGRNLDFAVVGEGYFAIQKANGDVVYTRNGSFTIDDGGYLALQHIGRVIGTDGPIALNTDKIKVDNLGRIYTEDGTEINQLAVTNFTDNNSLVKVGEGMFQNTNPANITDLNKGQIMVRTLERSNVESIKEMMSMMSSQRALQSASQVLKMYDQLLAKATTEIGRV